MAEQSIYFEIEHNNKHWALQLKGAGRLLILELQMVWLFYDRLQLESICGEAMYYLGFPRLDL